MPRSAIWPRPATAATWKLDGETLTVNTTTTDSFYGLILGTGGLTIQGTGSFLLSATGFYTGTPRRSSPGRLVTNLAGGATGTPHRRGGALRSMAAR